MTTEDIRIRCPSTELCRFGRSFNVTTTLRTDVPNMIRLRTSHRLNLCVGTFRIRGFCYCSGHAQYLSIFLHPDLLIRQRRCSPVYHSINPWTARVVHLDHGYFFSVKAMPIQQMTYAAASIFWHSLIFRNNTWSIICSFAVTCNYVQMFRI